MDRRPVGVCLGLILLGVAFGLVGLLADNDKTSTGAGVATANWIHVALGSALAAALVVTYCRHRQRLVTFMVRPFTRRGWSALLDALVGVPVIVGELGLLAVGQTTRATSVERWRARRVLALRSHQAPDPSVSPVRLLVALPLSVLALLAALLVLYLPFRAGAQIFAGLDPDFTRDAWGGPSYLGAALAHWLDSALIYYVCTLVIGSIAARRQPALDVLA